MKKLLWVLLVIFLVLGGTAGWFANILFGTAFTNSKEVEIRIRSGWTIEKLATEFQQQAGLKEPERFQTWVTRLGYKNVKPCTIKVPPKCSIRRITEILKANRYQTTNVTILGSMDKHKLGMVLAYKLEIDADSVVAVLSRPGNIYNTGFDDTTWPALLVPNTYNFAVGTDMKGFFARMKKEYDRYWNGERKALAQKQGLTPLQVAIVASIVTKESNKTDEYENIAGVYINRLRKDMMLQADPTVVFVRKRDGRVRGADLKIESPYNTYLHKGLPPGPICIPNLSSMQAVLNYTNHNYLYFVALSDFSGYHHFSSTLAEHLFWAAKFHAALNARNIR
jgi:UPF0755 protein